VTGTFRHPGRGLYTLTNSLPHGDSGWNIFVKSGATRFRSLVLGDQLVMITLNGVRVLSRTAPDAPGDQSREPGAASVSRPPARPRGAR
jgi:hypothetical protein